MRLLNRVLGRILAYTFFTYPLQLVIPFMGGLLICRFTGWVFFRFRKAVRVRILDAGCEELDFLMVKAVLLAFALPAGILAEVLERLFSVWKGCLTAYSTAFLFFFYFLFYLWLAGAVRETAVQLRKAGQMKKRFRNLIPCTPEKQEIFRQVCALLGVRSGRIRLYECYSAPVAFIRGIVFPKIILPAGENETDEQALRVILIHELTHYRQHAQFWKLLMRTVLVLQWWSPVPKALKKELLKSLEYCCDDAASISAGGAAVYYNILLKLALAHGTNLDGLYVSSVLERENDVLSRIRRAAMKKKTVKHYMRGLLTMTAAGILAISVAAGTAGACITGYVNLSEATRTSVEVPLTELEPLPVHTQPANADHFPEEIGEALIMTDTDFYTIWKVESGSSTVSTWKFFFKDQVVAFNGMIHPTDKTVKAGLRPLGKHDDQYFLGARAYTGSIIIPVSGWYRYFVSNTSDVSVDAVISSQTN